MRLSRNLFCVTLGSVLLAASAFAATATKGTLKLYEPVSVQGKQLAAGQYTVEVTGQGPNVELNIVGNGRQAVASIPARLVPVSAKNRTSGYSATKQQDGSSALTTVFFQGKDYERQLGEQAATTAPQPAASGSNQ